MARVFLSHSSADKAQVRRIANDLVAANIEVWLDQWEIVPGHSISQKIQEGLAGSDLLVVALTPASIASGWVEKEWRSRLHLEARTHQVQIIPLLLEPCDIPPLLADKLHVDLTGDYDTGLDALVGAVRTHTAEAGAIEAPAAPTSIPRPSPYQAQLLVSRDEDGRAQGHWEAPNLTDTEPFALALPLGEDGQEELRWYLETYVQYAGAGDRARARHIEQRLSGWGEALFEALFRHGDGRVVRRDLEESLGRGRPAVITLAGDDPEVLGQPWELLRDAGGPLGFQDVTIRRQLGATRPGKAVHAALPLRVLLVVSRPRDTGFIDPRNSIAPMLQALEALGPGQLQLDFCDPPSFAELDTRVSKARRQRRPYHIVHFDGHGTYFPRTGVGALCFEDKKEQTHLVPGPELGDLMVRQGVPLVLVEACRGADLSDRPVFRSVAPALLQSGVGSVIAFSHSVHIEAARLLVERFYEMLAEGLSVGEALAEARRALHARPQRWLHLGPDAETISLQDWFIPQLYQVGDDPVLVQAGTAASAPPTTRPAASEGLHGFPPEPAYRFHGRASELLALERAFRRHRAVLLHAMGGMGKTAMAREAAAWWLRTGHFEAAVFVSFEQRMEAEQVALALGRALQGEDFSSRDAAAQWRDAIALFHQRRVLLVWDNFESTLAQFSEGEAEVDDAGALAAYAPEARERLQALYGALVEGEPEGRLLVTCRPQESALAGIKEIALQGLARPDSLHLLAAVTDVKGIDTDRPGYERAQIEGLLATLKDHPLSIALVSPHLARHTPETIHSELGTLMARFADGTAPERRNQSLLASLEFSKRRLEGATRAVLPSLAWFRGGVFEDYLVQFAGLDPEAWAAMRAELVATALVRVEALDWSNTPFIHFHPTLPFAARASDVADAAAAEQRFIALYLAVMGMVDEALGSNQSAAGMALMGLEEANVRAAMERAFRRGERREGRNLANTLQTYLERAGRLREHRALVAWVREQMPAAGPLDGDTCAAIQDDAWGRFTQGRAKEAIDSLEDLLARLADEGLAGGRDLGLQVTLTNNYLGRVHYHSGRPDRALGPLDAAIAGFEELGEAQRGNLAAALGDRANALRDLGRLDESLAAAEQGLAINRALGSEREVAVGLGRTAQILAQQQRYAEADTRYGEALAAARAAGDLGLEGLTFQHQGALQQNIGNSDRAVALYRQALARFQQAGDDGNEMRTADLLGTAEAQRGHLDAAAAWYARSRELAEKLGARRQLAVTAQNMGILHQTRAEQMQDPAVRERELRLAVASVEESLAVKLEMGNRVGAAASYFQLGILHRRLGELGQAEDKGDALDRAEASAREALAIYESLNAPDVYKVYGVLAEIARARGDAQAAAAWQAKRDAKVAELKRLHRGADADGAPAEPGDQVTQAVLGLAQAAYHARTSKGPLPPEAAEALAQLREAPPPFDALGAFLQDVAGGQAVPGLPDGLPPQLAAVLKALAKAIRG